MWCRCWLPEEGLIERSSADKVPYDTWRHQGFLETTAGATISYEFVAQYLMEEVFQRYHVRKIAFDRYNFNHLLPWLLQAGFSEQQVKDTFVPFGQGCASMSPALRDLEAAILEKKIRHGAHPALTWCMNNSRIESDAAANRKLSKKRSRGRIDGAVALALGVAPMCRPAFDVTALIG